MKLFSSLPILLSRPFLSFSSAPCSLSLSLSAPCFLFPSPRVSAPTLPLPLRSLLSLSLSLRLGSYPPSPSPLPALSFPLPASRFLPSISSPCPLRDSGQILRWNCGLLHQPSSIGDSNKNCEG
ncbi:hypothetical protein MRB53_009908 [Persea americana]|uniref:Uncharacterized protein n=1 Tax=Persea americana TaxID=3435 RepID=A0ACC2LQF4_PERAE|nr:hypothetical protein MRB53_009908 [Persea americana]